MLANLKQLNTNDINTSTTLSNARIARNELLYAQGTGLVLVARDVKNYIRVIYGVKSPQYKQVSKLKFMLLIKM
jgi:hypothetical protein